MSIRVSNGLHPDREVGDKLSIKGLHHGCGDKPEVGREGDVRMAQQGMPIGQGFLVKYIERCVCWPASVKGGGQRCLIDESRPGGVDQHRISTHQ